MLAEGPEQVPARWGLLLGLLQLIWQSWVGEGVADHASECLVREFGLSMLKASLASCWLQPQAGWVAWPKEYQALLPAKVTGLQLLIVEYQVYSWLQLVVQYLLHYICPRLSLPWVLQEILRRPETRAKAGACVANIKIQLEYQLSLVTSVQ